MRVKKLSNKTVSFLIQRLHRILNRRISRDNYPHHTRLNTLQLMKKLRPLHIRQINIHKRSVKRQFLTSFNSVPAVINSLNQIALILQNRR